MGSFRIIRIILAFRLQKFKLIGVIRMAKIIIPNSKCPGKKHRKDKADNSDIEIVPQYPFSLAEANTVQNDYKSRFLPTSFPILFF